MEKVSLPQRIMEAYNWIIGRFLQIPNDEMKPTVRKALDDAEKWSLVDMGSKVQGVKPETENKQWFRMHRLPLIFKEVILGTIPALYHAIVHRHRIDNTDSDLELLFNDTFYDRLIEIDPKTNQPQLNLRHHGALPTLPGFYNHALTGILSHHADGRLALAAIEVDGKRIEPSHPAWSLAKSHLLVAMDNETLFTDHAVHHLNNNYLEAAAMRTLPSRNPLRLFLQPHFGIAIPLNEFILELLYKHTSPANPFGYPASSILSLINKGFEDDRRRGLLPKFPATAYGHASKEAFDVIHQFVADFVTRNLPTNSQAFGEVRAFMDECRVAIPHYPSGNELDQDTLTNIVARFVFEATFISSADHIVTYDLTGYFRTIFRIRRPFSETAQWRPSELFHPVDTFQRVMFRRVFSGDSCISLLKDVKYDESLSVDHANFLSNLKRVESRHPKLFPLDRVAATIDI